MEIKKLTLLSLNYIFKTFLAIKINVDFVKVIFNAKKIKEIFTTFKKSLFLLVLIEVSFYKVSQYLNFNNVV